MPYRNLRVETPQGKSLVRRADGWSYTVIGAITPSCSCIARRERMRKFGMSPIDWFYVVLLCAAIGVTCLIPLLRWLRDFLR